MSSPSCRVAGVLFFGCLLLSLLGFDRKESDSTPKSVQPIQISRKTTYVDGPTDKAGFVRFAAAINKRESRNVTADNNAVVLLLPVVGRNRIPAPLRDKLKKSLKSTNSQKDAPYFATTAEFAKQVARSGHIEYASRLRKELDGSLKAPWRKEKYLQLSRWHSSNRASLKAVVSAMKRQKAYFP